MRKTLTLMTGVLVHGSKGHASHGSSGIQLMVKLPSLLASPHGTALVSPQSKVRKVDHMKQIPTSDEINEILAVSEQTELKLLRDAADAATNTILVTDPSLPDNPIIYINPAFERLTGYAASEALGKNCRFLQGEDTEQVGVHLLRYAIIAHKPIIVELRNYRKDGTMFWNELHVTPIFKDGTPRYFVGIQHDVTARKEIEALFHKAQVALLASNKELKLNFEEKHAYIVEVAHQLQRPLATVIGFVELLEECGRRTEVPSEVGHYATIVKDAAEGMNAQLNTLLELAGSQSKM